MSVEITQADREAAANIWRDYIAKTGEIIVERNMRSGGLGDGLPAILAKHRSTSTEEVERLREEVALWKREAADRSEGMVALNLDRAAMGVTIMQLREVLEWADRHADDQDMNHVNYRIGVGSRARTALGATSHVE